MSSISLGEAHVSTKRATRARPVQPYDGREPWARRDVVVVALVLALAVAGLVVGWFGVSDTVDLNDQTQWLGLGIAALIVGGFGMVVWLLLGLRRVAVLRREVLTELDRRHPAPAARTARAPLTDRQSFGTVVGMRRYHAAGCQMLDDKDVTYADAAAHAGAGLLPCPICLGEGGSRE